MKRRKNRGVYFINRPAPTERAWLLEHGATEGDLAFPDPASDPLAGLFPDAGLREKFAPLLERLRAAASRALLFDEGRGAIFRAFAGVGPADLQGDHPEGLILLRAADPRAKIPGLQDDAPGARQLIAFYRGGLGAILGGNEKLGLALPAEVQPWSRTRKHDLSQFDFLPEHRTRNFRIFWDEGNGTEALFDAPGRVYVFRGGYRLAFRYDSVLRSLEEAVLRTASGRGNDPLRAEDLERIAPGHYLAAVARLREQDLAGGSDPAPFRAELRRLEPLAGQKDELADLNLSLLAREERWEELTAEMRRVALGPFRSLVDRPENWEALHRAARAREKTHEFREIALAAAQGPLDPESRGRICDLLIESDEVESAVQAIERALRPGAPPEAPILERLERLKAMRLGRGR